MNILNYELTNPQKSILLTEQFNENTCVSNICGTLSIPEKIDENAFEKAINLFIKNNDSVRLYLVQDGTDIKQCLKDYSFEEIEKVNITDTYSLSQLEEDVITKHFTLLNSNLYRFVIFKNEDGTGGFIANLHHMISDAWTMSLLIDQIMNYYVSIIQNTPIQDVKNSSYLDFIDEEKKYIESSKFERAKNFWESQFENLEFSYLKDFQSGSYEAIRKSVILSKEETNTLVEFCNSHKVSLFSLFMAILNIYLAKINNTNSSIVGTPILNRCNFKEKNTTGMYISTVPFRMEIGKDCSCIDFIEQVSKHELSVFRNQRYPYNRLLDTIRKKFNISKNLYDVCLSYQNARNHRASCAVPYSCRWLFNHCVVNNLDIHLYDIDDTGMISIYYDFKKELFTLDEINLLHERLMAMLTQIIANPELKIKDLETVSPKEKIYILEEYNHTKTTDNFVSVYDLFKRQLQKTPDKLAICYKDTKLTYKELNTFANLLASKLKDYDVHAGDIVCLAFTDSIEFVASILATQKLGVCYIPIDVNYPNERIEYIANNSQAKLILTHPNTLKSVKIDKDTVLRISLDDFDYQKEDIVNIDYALKEDIVNIDYALKEDDLAYIIYTSGSTGNPKGVKISHKSLANYICWAIKQYVHGEETNFPLFSSVAFDLTVTSVYTPLCSGNSIYIYQNENAQLLLEEIIKDNHVQIIKMTPGHFTLLQDLDLSNSIVSKFILGGDILTKEMCEKITSMFSHPIHIYNEYGPTEATVGCMIYEYRTEDTYTSVPIGYPIDNTQILLLNQDLELVPLGHIGEMYISGDCLALGYTDEQKTLDKFIDNPFYPGQKIYKTGDLAILHSDGIMEYLGRTDFQVKLNGYRIELGEIQSDLLTHPNIKDVYIALITIDEHKFLCAYYVSDKEIEDLSSFLKKTLPSYMIPTYFIKLDKIPLTINGKVDKSALPLPKKNHNKYVKPQNKLEETLQEIFTELLEQKSKISVEDDLFDYYVDSLLLIKAQSILYSKGISINTQDFYEYPTIRKLADFLLVAQPKETSVLIEKMPIIKEIKKPIDASKEFRRVILFGATGFLGIHILYFLLLHTSCKVFCVIRKKDLVDPLARFIKKFNFYFPNVEIEHYLYRIKIVEGNILDNHFGIEEDLYNRLGTTCDCVIDTAALVKHYGNYEVFNKTNVNSTKKMIAFCKEFKIPLHYVSTMSVSGNGLVKTPDADFTEDDLYIGQDYKKNVYVRSKFEAEKAVIEACKEEGFVASIYRLGTITNRYFDGMFQENFNDNAFLNRLEAFIDLGIFPKELSQFCFEFSPVDVCANFIVQLLQHQQENLEIYHLYNNRCISGENLVNMINTCGVSIDFASLDDFKTALAKSKSNYFGITAYVKNINDSMVTLHNEKTLTALQTLNLDWPEITPEYLNKILLYLRKKHC